LARLHAQDGPGGSSSPDARIFAVVGDLAFLHDHNGLLAPTEERRPNLTLVVVDNNGGGIFSSLEQGSDDYQGDFERVFGTPPDQDLVAIAAATGWQTHSVTTNAELRAALAASATGTQVIVVRAADRIVEQRQWAEVLGTDEEGKDLPR
jgi:2-succinyl-5-enolpyruvyl-6-hydroxy-3-cyclohexene-1-carboxylate synthase